LSKTKGKTITSIEFDDPLLELLKTICTLEQSSMSRLVRIACTAFAIDYVTANEGKWKKPVKVTVAHIREARRSDDAVLLALAALTGKSERTVKELSYAPM
jgi:hypothetical protein